MPYWSQLYLAYDAVSVMLPMSVHLEGHLKFKSGTSRLSNQAKLFLRMSFYFQKAAFNTRRHNVISRNGKREKLTTDAPQFGSTGLMRKLPMRPEHGARPFGSCSASSIQLAL